jgi:osmoprotectant transport system substrate-binding protein
MSQRSTRRNVLKGTGAVLGTAGLGSLAGCSSLVSGNSGDSVTIGSKKFPEQQILGYLAFEALKENTDLTVKDEVSLGGSTTNFKALQSGDIDMYWEYTGTAWLTLPPSHSEVITDPEEIYSKAEADLEEQHDLTFLERAPFNNTYVLLANPDWQSKTGISTLSGLADHVKGGNSDLTMVMGPEFQERSDGWPGLTKAYGFESAAKNLAVKNVKANLTYQVLGQGEADIGVGFNTNPKILKFDLETLEDDQGFFPVYNPAPLVDMETLENNDAMREPLNSISGALTTDKIRELNRRASIDGEAAQQVASDFLSNENII